MENFRLTTPVAFFIFNRADTTRRVFEAIRRARPERLLVVADGARDTRPGERERCEQTRAILDGVDWDCEVVKNYSAHNLGCRNRFATGLSWIFEQSEEAIILEDDCLPAPSFFPYCQALLERYREDPRVFLISGDNFLGARCRNKDSYYFTQYTYLWGWAAWRRTFERFDVNMQTWPDYRASGRLGEVCKVRGERRFWQSRFDQVHARKMDTWDYQVLYSGFRDERLSIAPEKNLISNIGFSDDATHLALGGDEISNLPVSDIWQIEHPPRVERDFAADAYVFKHIYQGTLRRVAQHLRKGYDRAGLLGLGRSTLDLAQRSMKLLSLRW